MSNLGKLLLSMALLLVLQPSMLAQGTEPTFNNHYTPALLPNKAEQRGICLSGDARLIELANNHYKMSCGMILIDTDVPMQIDTHRGSVFAKAHSAVLISKTKEALRVFDLHDRVRNSVQLKFGKNQVNLNAGMEAALVDKSFKNATEIAICPTVGYRQPRVLSVNEKENLVLLEFSIADKLKYGKIFAQLRESPVAQDHKLLAQIEKTAAAINTMFHKNIGAGGVAGNRGWVTGTSEGREDYADHEKRTTKSKLAQDKETAI